MNLFKSIRSALEELRDDRLRTLLSLLGVSVGIFSIVTVLTITGALKRSVQGNLNRYGGNLLLVEKIPLENENDGSWRWWDYLRRPEASFEEYRYLAANLGGGVSFMTSFTTEITARGLSTRRSHSGVRGFDEPSFVSPVRIDSNSDGGASSGQESSSDKESFSGRESSLNRDTFSGRESSLGSDQSLGDSLELRAAPAMGNVSGVELAPAGLRIAGYGNRAGQYIESTIIGVAGEWREPFRTPLVSGRLFTEKEISGSAPVCLVGHTVAQRLEGAEKVRICGIDATVLGIFEKEGSQTAGMFACDEAVIVPFGFFCQLKEPSTCSSRIICSSADRAEVTGLMRNIRRLRPVDKENFAVNSLEFLSRQIASVTKTLDMVGIIIGLFSLLIGIFGVANIMYVSVADKRVEYGIRRALGATRRAIVGQVLTESALLSLGGGLLGVAATLLLCLLASLVIPRDMLQLRLTLPTLLFALALSLAAGLLSGLFPARRTASLDPVDAIRK